MREIIVHRHATGFAARFQASFDVGETRQCRQAMRKTDPDVAGRQQCCTGIGTVMFASERPLTAANFAFRPMQDQLTAGIVTAHPVTARMVETLHRRPAGPRQHPFQRRLVAVADDQTAGRQSPHKMMELRFDGRQVGKDVGVVELQIVQHQRAWMVVDELGALVTEGRVVFVSFDDEERGVAETRRDTKVFRYATDEEPGRHAGLFEYPGEHGAGGGLAMRAGNPEHPAPAQDVLGQPLRPGHIGQPLIQNRLQQRIAARNGIADHEHIRLHCGLPSVVALRQSNARLLQLLAHRRIDIGIATADAVPCCHGQLRQAAHESAADAEDVNVHDVGCG